MVIFGNLVLYLFGHVVIFSVIWIRSNGSARTSPLFKSSPYFFVRSSSYVLHANYSNTVWMQSITTILEDFTSVLIVKEWTHYT